MLRKIWGVIGVVALAPGSFGTTFTVDQSGAGGAFTTLQAAVNAVAADPATPHTIHVVDGATYVEDVFITNNPLAGGSPNLNGLTVAGVPGPATIQAPHTRSGAGSLGVILAALGAPGSPDACGFYIEADGVSVRDLVLASDGPRSVVIGRNSAVTVTADDVTFEGCAFVADDTRTVSTAAPPDQTVRSPS